MTFVSYAQNFEDVMLWRALKHIDSGFYIDVGAWSPELDSVTKAFYERGWRGINVEPNPAYHGQLEHVRVRDVNLCVALSDEPGTGTMRIVGESGLSTLDDGIAAEHEEAGYAVESIQTNLVTLSSVWIEHVPENQAVHFLKIDVEGFEERVIRGADLTRQRPWIILIEATYPMSQVEIHAQWESHLLDANYRMAYADGLNRFYVAGEHDHLANSLRYPPNCFDEFRQYTLVSLEEQLVQATQSEEQARQALSSFEGRLLAESRARSEAQTSLSRKAAEVSRLEQALAQVHGSWSWRITWPLRAIVDVLNRLLRVLKGVFYGTVRSVAQFAIERPRIMANVSSLLDRLPAARRLMSVVLNSAEWNPEAARANQSTDVGTDTAIGATTSKDHCRDLSEDARSVYEHLNRSLGANRS